MKKNKLFRITLMAVIMGAFTALTLTGCDDSYFEDEGSFRMEGSGSGAYYTYRFTNSSSHEVTVTIDGSTKKLPAKSSTAVSITASYSPVSVKYSPSSKVTYLGTSISSTFYNK